MAPRLRSSPDRLEEDPVPETEEPEKTPLGGGNPRPVVRDDPFVKSENVDHTDTYDDDLYRAIEMMADVGSDKQRADAQFRLDLIDSGQASVAQVAQELGGRQGKMAAVIDSAVVKPVVEGFTTLESITASGLNSFMELLPTGGAFDFSAGELTKPPPTRPADSREWLGAKGFLAGLSVPYSDDGIGPVGTDPLSFMDEVDNQFIPQITPEDSDFRLFGFLGGGNLPDLETVLRLSLAAILDPINAAGKPGILVAKGAGLRLTDEGIRGVKNHGLALARASKAENIEKAVTNYWDLPAGVRAGAEDWFPNVLRDLREGNVSRAVKRARKGDSGYTLNNLESLGFQTRMTLGGHQVPLSGRAVSVLGNFATGRRTPELARAERAFYQDIPGRIGESAGRAMDNMKASGIRELLTSKIDLGGLDIVDEALEVVGQHRVWTEWDLYTAERLFREAGNRATGSLMAEGSDAIRATIRDSDLILKSKQYKALPENPTQAQIDKAVREAGDDLSKEIADAVQQQVAGKGAKGRLENSRIASTIDALEGYTEKHGMTVGDLNPESMLAFTNDINISVADRLMAGAIVWGLKKLDDTSLKALPDSATQLAHNVQPSHTVKQLVGPNGKASSQASTLRQFYNHVALLETVDAAMQTGRGQLSENLWRATQNPVEAVAALGLDGTIDHLNLAGRNLPPGELLKNQEEVHNLIQGTTTPKGMRMPLAFIQALGRAGDFTPVLKGDYSAIAANLARITGVGLKHLEGLKRFVDGLGKQDGIEFLEANKAFASQAKRDADEFMTGGPGGYRNLPKAPGENGRWKEATVKARRTEIYVRTEVVSRIRNGWHNPEMGRMDSAFSMFSNSDRAFLARVKATYPDMIAEELNVLEEWLTEWTKSADRFKLYDESMSVIDADMAKGLDLWAAEATLTVRLFGGEAVDELNGTITDGVMRALTREEADLTAGRIMAGRAKRTGVGDFFGEISQTPAGRGVYNDIKDGSYRAEAVFHSKNTETKLAGVLLEASDFLDNLGKIKVDQLQGSVDYLVRQRRLFSSAASATPGFFSRNGKGGLIMNWVRGVRTDSYTEYIEHSGIARRAKTHENSLAEGLGANGSSPIWKEIADEEKRAVAQRIHYSGQTTAGSASGDMLDFQFELDQAAVRVRTKGNRLFNKGSGVGEQSKAGKAQASLTRTLDRVGSRSEQLIQPPLRRIASGGRTSGDGYSRQRFSRDAQEGGLPSAHRETTEELLRGALLHHNMTRKGMSFDAAMADVASTHYDYWDFTAAGRMADAMMPFYLFRARITSTTLDLILSTPGMGAQLARAERVNGGDDTSGDGLNGKPYTLGSGIVGDYDFFGRVDDPRSAGLKTIKSVSNILGGDIDQLLKDEVFSQLNPAVDYVIARGTDTKSGFGEARADGARQANQTRYQDGLVPRLAEGVAWSAAKIDLVVEAMTGVELGNMNPLIAMLKATGNFQIIDGELWSTEMAEEWLTDRLPMLGVIESVLRNTTGLKAEHDPNGRLTEEEWNQAQTGKAWNSYLGGFGVPVELVWESQRAAWVAAIERRLDDMAEKLSLGETTQEHIGEAMIKGLEDAKQAGEREFLESLAARDD